MAYFKVVSSGLVVHEENHQNLASNQTNFLTLGSTQVEFQPMNKRCGDLLCVCFGPVGLPLMLLMKGTVWPHYEGKIQIPVTNTLLGSSENTLHMGVKIW